VRAVLQRARDRRVDLEARRALPVTIDLLAVAISAGCTPYLAVAVAAEWAPAPLSARLHDVRRSCDLGAGFADALEATAEATPALAPLADALLSSDRFGAPVGDALVRLAAEERADLRRRAEAHARRVPVRLLFPLVFLVLPAFALLTVAPALLEGLGRA
jgi:tight adherence protein C